MLYSVAIMKRPTEAEDTTHDGADLLIYGPVTINAARHDDMQAVANRVIAQAANEGKLPGGWGGRHYVAGLSYSAFT